MLPFGILYIALAFVAIEILEIGGWLLIIGNAIAFAVRRVRLYPFNGFDVFLIMATIAILAIKILWAD